MPGENLTQAVLRNGMRPSVEPCTRTARGGPWSSPTGGLSFPERLRGFNRPLRETNPLDGDSGFKVYAAGVGLVIDEAVALVS
ncbi:MAG: hypothetical protein H0V09_04155 [Gemmatimonadetes bacterium]|nr:hypothetical protein [Gemmatimonadota bacterium]